MDKNRFQGTSRKLKGSGMEALALWTGGSKSRSEDRVETVTGNVQNEVGVIKDAARTSRPE